MQHRMANKFTVSQRPRFATTIALVGMVLMVVSLASMSLAQKSTQKTFASAEEASHALFLAVQSDDQPALMLILGGGEEKSSPRTMNLKTSSSAGNSRENISRCTVW